MSEDRKMPVGEPVNEFLAREEKAQAARRLIDAVIDFNDAIADAQKSGLDVTVELNNNRVNTRVKNAQ